MTDTTPNPDPASQYAENIPYYEKCTKSKKYPKYPKKKDKTTDHYKLY